MGTYQYDKGHKSIKIKVIIIVLIFIFTNKGLKK